MKRQLLFRSPIRGISGYATYARNLLFNFLNKYDDEYVVELKTYPWQEFDLPLLNLHDEMRLQILERVRVNKKQSVLVNWTLPHEYIPDCAINIGYTLFETDRIIDKWRHACNAMDIMWLPSTFNKLTFRDSGVTPPIKIVPGGVDDIFFEDFPALDIPEITTDFNFITGGQWIPGTGDRKNMGKILRCFCDEFRDDKNVGLIMKVYTINNNTIDYLFTQRRIEEIKEEMGVGEYPKVYLVHGMMSRDKLIGLFKRANAAVMPSPEGWGMWHIQAAATGLPVIAYDWSSYTDFLKPEWTPYVKVKRMVQVPQDMKHLEPYAGVHFWADLDLVGLKKMMRDVIGNYSDWKSKAELQKGYLKNNWTWGHAADKMHLALQEAYEMVGNSSPCYKPFLPPCPVDYKPVRPTYIIVNCHGNRAAVGNFINSYNEFYTATSNSSNVEKVILIDNGSPEDYQVWDIFDVAVKQYPDRYKVLILDKLLPFSEADNLGINIVKELCSVDCNILFMDANTFIVDTSFISKMSWYLNNHDNAACVGCKINYPDNTIFSAGVRVQTNTFNGISLGIGEVDRGQYDYVKLSTGVSGAAMMWKSSVLYKLGGFNTSYFLPYKNVELQMRALNGGYDIIYAGDSSVIYDKETVFRNPDFDIAKIHQQAKMQFVKVWKDIIKNGLFRNID
jgi:GT2 family glycosyltransferase/glycosyltransferase involved in cell wall biosynthesis